MKVVKLFTIHIIGAKEDQKNAIFLYLILLPIIKLPITSSRKGKNDVAECGWLDELSGGDLLNCTQLQQKATAHNPNPLFGT
ncbi:hypothetical protein SESBI_51118 [Sesbania bispinosa]|nr:hypothetical protein SESBI_51118 [Sesbania bispinosa]